MVGVGNVLGKVRVATDDKGQRFPVIEHVIDDDALRSLWTQLPSHPALLEAVGVTERGVLLRYAAVTNRYSPREANDDLTRYGAVIADVYRAIVPATPAAELGRFLEPFVVIDVAHQLRVGFKPCKGWTPRMPHEVERTWPCCDERTLVYMIGELISDHIFTRTRFALHEIFGRLYARNPKRRFQTLDEAHAKLRAVGKLPSPTSAGDTRTWQRIEEGLGWLEVGDAAAALPLFEDYVGCAKYGEVARAGAKLARPPSVAREIPVRLPATWESVGARVLELEAMGDLQGAARICAALQFDEASRGTASAVMARIYYALDRWDWAIEHAKRALLAEPSSLASRIVLAKSLHASGRHHDALAQTEHLLAHAADDAAHHYLRGKILIALGRLGDARASFDRAATLRPSLVEAMLLRRQVDRAISAGNKTVGSQKTPTFDVPESLSQLRELLLAGGVADAIAALSELADNPDAQLLLSRLLVFDGQLARSLEVCDRATRFPDPHGKRAVVGKACVLVEMGEHAPALALLDSLCSTDPADVDAAEARARALEKLGRIDEAAREYQRFVSLATAGSDNRVRAAQLWLDKHR